MTISHFVSKLIYTKLNLPFSVLYWNESIYEIKSFHFGSAIHKTQKYVHVSNYKISNALINFNESIKNYEE